MPTPSARLLHELRAASQELATDAIGEHRAADPERRYELIPQRRIGLQAGATAQKIVHRFNTVLAAPTLCLLHSSRVLRWRKPCDTEQLLETGGVAECSQQRLYANADALAAAAGCLAAS